MSNNIELELIDQIRANIKSTDKQFTHLLEIIKQTDSAEAKAKYDFYIQIQVDVIQVYKNMHDAEQLESNINYFKQLELKK